jgi:hypothetical protein
MRGAAQRIRTGRSVSISPDSFVRALRNLTAWMGINLDDIGLMQWRVYIYQGDTLADVGFIIKVILINKILKLVAIELFANEVITQK